MADVGEESGDDDYMNDDIVKQCEAAAASANKSGIKLASTSLASASTVRQITIEKRHVAKAAEARADAKKMNPRARLEEGLSTALSEENVGFRLLSKMGFKPGTGLGKLQTGRAEPIPLEFRQGRSGLGREVIRNRLDAERDAARQRIVEMHRSQSNQDPSIQFAEYQRRRKDEHRTRRDLNSARKACFDLDSKLEIKSPFKNFYWPERALPVKPTDHEESTEVVSSDSENERGDEKELPLEDQLEELSAYLRLQHMYCLWCGTVYENAEDLASNCPGPSAEFHDL